jgi:endonuclease/exonuclease/phosphatase family metal-dependent hydrolase
MGNATTKDEPIQLNVMTYNIRFDNPDDKGTSSWGYRRRGLVDVICRYKPDLLGCQEVLENQLQFIAEGLGSDFTHIGKPREYNAQTKQYWGEYSCIFFNNKRFELLDSGTFWLSDTPDVPGSHGWDAACTRICSWCKLKEQNSGKIIFHFNTHWDHVGVIARTKSSGLIKSRMLEQLVKSKQAGEPEPIMIVTGDFNCQPNSQELLLMFQQIHDMTDDLDLALRYTKLEAQQRKGPDATFTGFDFKSHETIDYIFYQDGWHGKRSWQVPLYQVIEDTLPGGYPPSDHRPVFGILDSANSEIQLDNMEDDFVIVDY